MKILLVGATGTLGRAVHSLLGPRHEIVAASRSGAAGPKVDLTDPASIAALYAEVGRVDAVMCAAGGVPFRPVGELTYDDLMAGARDKMLGQVELVRRGVEAEAVADGGSFTLITGILSHEPISAGAVAAMANGAVDAFVRAAATELPRGQRINAVSPTMLTESLSKYDASFPGFEPVPAELAAKAYRKSAEGIQTGRTYRVGW
ncbi:short chain dehydrogenase [Streptomyces spiroverticillatus]|uniref:Short chain dehydrogenase n=1 Tax=Streptomyces finlayi TaxID=67296 RepID=A0A918X484_9ACTN|nr:short chain dehydrogenase [Streptomyces finlayi]GHA32552.1 short chain dehydrogenase [Streptomyces spiroverticillatus]GHD10500.1 short chain dehydrogenase [Streptomyces finlayi]